MDPREATKSMYDKAAKNYADMWFNFRKVERLLDRFMEYLKGGSVILDVGSGSGRDVIYLNDHGFRSVGMDISKGQIRESVKRVNHDFILGDMRKIPVAGGTFGGLLSITSLLHIPGKENPKVILEFYRVLRKGGVLLITVHEGRGERFEKRPRYSEGDFFHKYHTEEEIRDLLKSAGFEIISLEITTDKNKKYIEVFARKP